MKFKRLIGVLALTMAALAAGAANAALLRFAVTGDYSATWDMESSVAPSDFLNGAAFIVWTVQGDFGGAVHEADLTFFNAAGGGGLNIYDFQSSHNLLATDGPQLYTGTESAPLFSVGTFALTEFRGPGTYTLTVAEVAAVPEPATAALTLTGLALLCANRQRRRAH